MDNFKLGTSHMRLTLGLWGFLAALIAIAVFCEVDIATTGAGRIIPDGQVKSIQSFETGIVAEIAVRDGVRVEAGDVLVRLDTKDALADARRTATDLAIARVEFARLKATIDWEQGAAFDPPEDSPQYAIAYSEHLMRNQIREITSAISQVDADIREKESYIVSTGILIEKYKQLLPVMQEREKMFNKLTGTQAASRLSHLDEIEKLINAQGDLREQESKLNEAEAALASLREKRKNTILKFRSDRLGELVEMQRKMLTTEQDHIKATERLRRHTIISPIPGTVQDMTVYTVGGVVSPTDDSLMTIVPLDSKLIVEAFVANKDVGFLRPDQKAELKVTTFDYRRYGTVGGKVLSVSRDAVRSDSSKSVISSGKSQTSSSKGQSDRLSESKKLNPGLDEGSVFRVEISLDQSVMNIDGIDTELISGMSVDVNILTSRRRIIEFFLAPFQSYQDQAFRQR
jgi:hemolysin D